MNSQRLHGCSTGILSALAWVVGWQVSLQSHMEKPAGVVNHQHAEKSQLAWIVHQHT